MDAEPRTRRGSYKILRTPEDYAADKAEMERPLTPEEMAEHEEILRELEVRWARTAGHPRDPVDAVEDIRRSREERISRILGEDYDEDADDCEVRSD
jgi:hypothetical protein